MVDVSVVLSVAVEVDECVVEDRVVTVREVCVRVVELLNVVIPVVAPFDETTYAKENGVLHPPLFI